MRRKRNPVVTTVLAVILGLVFLTGLTWGNYRFAKSSPGGNDFLTRWVGTRALITQGMNPYSDEVAQQIQTIAYGAPVKPGQDEMRFAYPLYSILIFMPFSLFSDYNLARAAWMTVLEISLILITVLSLRLARWKVGPLMMAFLVLFGLLWYHGVRPLINGNAVILVTLLLVGGLLALRNGADELAGVLFAFSTIKPQIVVLVLFFIVSWCLVNRRGRVVAWMAGTLFLLTAASALLIPTWIVDNIREVLRYPGYNPPGTPRAAFIEWWPSWGSRVGWALTGLVALLILLEWWKGRKSQGTGFLWAVCLTLVAGQWSGIQTDPGNFIILFPAVILVFSLLDDRWKTGGRVFTITSLLLLLVLLWVLFLNTVQIGNQPQQSAVMFFPLPGFLLLLLYWVRWWAIQPPNVWFDRYER